MSETSRATLALLLVSLSGLAAHAQTPTTVPIGVDFFPAARPTMTTFAFGAASCHDSLLVGWTVNLISTTACSPLHVWTTTGQCGDAAAAGDHVLPDIDQVSVTTLRSGTFRLELSALPGFDPAVDGGVACGASGVQLVHQVCGAVSTAPTCFSTFGVTLQITHATALTVTYDTKPPTTPTAGDVSAFDGTVRISFTADTDTVTVGAQVRGPDDSDFVERATASPASQTSVVVKDLENVGADGGPVYLMRLVAYDLAGNQSAPTEAFPVSIIHTEGFWGAYRAAGGTDPAGCGSTPGAVVTPLLVALGLWVSRRRLSRRNDDR